MYPNQGSPNQWNNNSNGNGQPPGGGGQPPGWSPQPPNGHYTPRQQNADTSGTQIPPISQALPQGQQQMPTMQPPQHPDQYRAVLPPPQHMYPPPYQHPPPMGYAQQQPAPRQRTAIACRYCRRRKIRCSGFDQSEDGRCTNCQRFSQECIFTPVSAQTQAFVPAHTVYRNQNVPPNQQLYGAYGQPLHGARDPYPPAQQPGQYPPAPQGYQQQPMYQQPPPQQAQMQTPQSGQKRSSDEPHTPTLPPPNPGAQAQMPQQSGGGQQYGYPDPSGLPVGASPASPTAQYPVQPYYRTSPQSAYSYQASRGSSSSPYMLDQPVAQRHGVQGKELMEHQQQQWQQQQAQAQAALKLDDRTSHDTNPATAAPTTDGAPSDATPIRNAMVDASVQTDNPSDVAQPAKQE